MVQKGRSARPRPCPPHPHPPEPAHRLAQYRTYNNNVCPSGSLRLGLTGTRGPNQPHLRVAAYSVSVPLTRSSILCLSTTYA
eukprot:3770299-Rhodomonas_salina.1